MQEQARIKGLIDSKQIKFPEGVELVKNAIRTGEGDAYHDWPERVVRVRDILLKRPLDAVLFQEVSYKEGEDHSKNITNCVSTLGNVLLGTNMKLAQYCPFGISFKDEADRVLEERLQRGNAVVVGEGNISTNAARIDFVVETDAKRQVRAAAVTTFKTRVLGEEIFVRAVSVQVKGYWSGAYRNLQACRDEVSWAGNKPSEDLLKKLQKAESSYETFKTDYNVGNQELISYLENLALDNTPDLTIFGGDFNFCKVSGDGVVESGLETRTAILQRFGYTVDEKFSAPTQGKRTLDYIAFKLGETAKDRFNVVAKLSLIEQDGGDYVSDHGFVALTLNFSTKSMM